MSARRVLIAGAGLSEAGCARAEAGGRFPGPPGGYPDIDVSIAQAWQAAAATAQALRSRPVPAAVPGRGGA